MAEDMTDPVSKQKMLDVASNYEHLAKRAEGRKTGIAPKPHAGLNGIRDAVTSPCASS